MKYNPKKVEKKWQKRWEEDGLYRAEDFDDKPKYYALVEFPYPSGDGLHVGHARGYSALDIVARYKRMNGFNVLYPIGFDAFGLPTENFAIKNKIHPQVATDQNIKNFTRQLKSFGYSFDWDRVINTTDPEYYKWTQWIFLKLYEKDMAYRDEVAINWCPKCKTGLANEEVVNGKHERCDCEVEKKILKQWIIRITKYADRLIKDLDKVDYPDRVKTQQINWIGRSEGVLLDFEIENKDEKISVFTTRADTLFGATYMVLAPEHKLVSKLKNDISNFDEVKKYIEQSNKKSDRERITEEAGKTGIELKGVKAINPVNKKSIPIWIADYVLTDYGTGAIMAVPAHDERDFEFAKKFNIPIIKVILPPALQDMVRNAEDIAAGAKTSLRIESDLYIGEGTLTNSDEYNDMSSKEAGEKITEKFGKKDVQYKLRDWIFSRQHYWGEPIPIIYCEKCGEMPVPEEDLPVLLPDVENYEPTDTGESPLANIDSFVNTKCPKCDGDGKRETDTMPNWAGSNWYFIRYLDSNNKKEFAARDKMDYWLPVDWYNGGMEHTTLHLLYSRFIYKFLSDQELVPGDEPYAKRTSHGVVLAEDGKKMSKSLGNAVNPDDVVEKFGADTLRMYEMFIAPFDQMVPWDSNGVIGAYRFLNRLNNFYQKGNFVEKESKEENRIINKLIKKTAGDLESIKFNTAISGFMKALNGLEELSSITKETLEKYLITLAPFAPHITEELWQEILKNKESIHLQKWPDFDPKLIEDDKINLVVQVNGKTRDIVEIVKGISEDEARELVLSLEKIKKHIGDKNIKKFIYIPNKLANIVV